MIKLLSLLCVICGMSQINLNNINVIGGNYNSQFFFTLYGTTEEHIQEFETEKIKIIIEEDEAEVNCSVEEIDQRVIYSCIYPERIEDGKVIYLKKEQDNIFGIEENKVIEPLKLTIEFKEINNLKLIDSDLEFNLKVQSESSLEIIIGSIFHLGIKEDSLNKLSECMITSEEINKEITTLKSIVSTCIVRNINIGANSEVNITKVNFSPYKGSVTFIPFLQKDINIISSRTIEFVSSSNLKFNQNGRWEFYITLKKKNNVIDSRAIVDISFNKYNSTANCITLKNYRFYCIVDNEHQTQLDLVELNFYKTNKSTITWTNANSLLGKEEKILLYTELTYSQANFKKGPNSFWIFNVLISDDNIPNNSKVTIDIYYNLYLCSLTCREGEESYVATCLINNKILNCETELDTKYNYLLSLKKEKSSSSSVTWKNLELRSTPMYLIANTSLNYIDNKIFNGSAYIFYLKLGEDLPKGAPVTLDIIINNAYSIIDCITIDNTNLKCQVTNYPKNTLIYVSKIKSETTTLTLTNLEKNEIATNVNLGFIGAFDNKYEDGKSKFKILTYDNYLIDDVDIEIGIKYPYNEKKKGTYIYECSTKNDFLICEIENHPPDYFELLVNSGKYLETNWINGIDDTVEIDSSHSYNFVKIKSFLYNNTNEIYEIKIDIQEQITSKIFAVIDISIGDLNTYAYCNGINYSLDCKTKKMKSSEDDFYLLKDKNYGSITWKNLKSNLKFNELISVDVSNIYDLNFINNVWKFKIESKTVLNFDDIKTLDILLSGINSLATCSSDNYILNCEVVEENQNNYQLIELNKCYEGDIQLINNNYTFIPLNINLKFLHAYNLQYEEKENKYIFEINALLTDNKIIVPKNSTFTIDIIEINNNKNELAYCYQKDEVNSNQIKLLCKTMNYFDKYSLISLSNTKSIYSSITWNENINDLDIYMKFELDVKAVKSLTFNSQTNKWNFEMIIDNYFTGIPLNSKIKIDINYQNEDSTASCIYDDTNGNKKYLCSPDYLEQSINDIFEISYIKKYGTVTYKNDNKNLLFKKFAKLTFEKSYDLKYEDNKWKFKIKVSESNLKINDSILIDIYHEGYDSTAYCIMDSDNLLICESLYNYQTNKDFVCLRYDKKSENVEWKNLSDGQKIYVFFNIKYVDLVAKFELKWELRILYEPVLNLYQMDYEPHYALIDILINEKESTAECEISTFYEELICQCDYDNQSINDRIKLMGNKNPKSGTVSFYNELSENQKSIKPYKISIKNFAIRSYKNKNNILYISITGDLSNSTLYESTITEIEVIITKIDKRQIKSRATCSLSKASLYLDIDVSLYCQVDEKVLDNEVVKIKVDNYGFSKYVRFVYLDEQNNNINKNILINYLNDNWEKEDELYDYEEEEENLMNSSSIISSKMVCQIMNIMILILLFMN